MNTSGRDAIFSGDNEAYIHKMYLQYLDDPQLLDSEWKEFFTSTELDVFRANGPSWGRAGGAFVSSDLVMGENAFLPEKKTPPPTPEKKIPEYDQESLKKLIIDNMQLIMLIRAYRVRGHLKAKLDPLEMNTSAPFVELDPRTYGFTEADMPREFVLNNILGLEKATLAEILQTLNDVYCSSIGFEFMHIIAPDQKLWLQQRMENKEHQVNFTKEDKIDILRDLIRTEGFERFLHIKYVATKRFGLDGGESVMPMLNTLILRSSELGVNEVVLGMSHRGRLNVLANLMHKPYRAIFSEFNGTATLPKNIHGQGDVKYHLGASFDHEFGGKMVHLSLAANPSHLEIVDPVVLGKVKAKQFQRQGDDGVQQVMGILMHGDAAFSGQGIVAECFGLSDLEGYRTGGTAHVIVNNQIGFTTNPMDSRSSPYASDIAKSAEAPIFHVNGDDPQAIVRVAQIAADFRQQFKRDVVLDLICYRRYGHNEGDEPSFTQPLMYKKIAQKETIQTIYSKKLIAEGVITQEEVDGYVKEFEDYLNEEFTLSKTYQADKADWLEGKWSGLEIANSGARRGQTGIKTSSLKSIGKTLCATPKDFNLHKTLKRVLANKEKMIETGQGIDWSTAEALAFGSLLKDGLGVRLSGQDCGRGTFSQRHAVWIDQVTEEKYSPLENISSDQGLFQVYNSMLSEVAVLGYEYGYTLAEPKTLVMWEAQFGDFANVAQAVIDQFISSGEGKWLRMSGIVLALPHGYEGQGPEHSSARPERFLQLCAEDNMQIANVTTPAQYFHILRRQLHRNFRKPLVLFTPKSLLRHKKCISQLSDMDVNSSFHRILWDDYAQGEDKDIKRVILCSGKVYYDLVDMREELNQYDTYILRIEQLYPFSEEALALELNRFQNAKTFVWCQEEPKNMGYWFFINHRIDNVLRMIDSKVSARLLYAGRVEAASPASGFMSQHKVEQKQLVLDSFQLV